MQNIVFIEPSKVDEKNLTRSLNIITDKQNKIIDELQGQIKILKRQVDDNSKIILEYQKKIFDIEIENKILSERILENNSNISNTTIDELYPLDKTKKQLTENKNI